MKTIKNPFCLSAFVALFLTLFTHSASAQTVYTSTGNQNPNPVQTQPSQNQTQAANGQQASDDDVYNAGKPVARDTTVAKKKSGETGRIIETVLVTAITTGAQIYIATQNNGTRYNGYQGQQGFPNNQGYGNGNGGLTYNGAK